MPCSSKLLLRRACGQEVEMNSNSRLTASKKMGVLSPTKLRQLNSANGHMIMEGHPGLPRGKPANTFPAV